MAAREYDVIDPTVNWAREDSFDTLLVYLPGFRKEQLRVQITSAGNLRVMGERQVSGNKWNRISKEMPIASNYDSNKITAKFDGGILHVKFPKIAIPGKPRGEAKPAVQPAKPPQPTTTAEPQKMGPKQDVKETPEAEQVPAKPTEEEEKPEEVVEESKRADEEKNGPETALQQRSEDSAEKKATENDQKRGDTGDIGQPKAQNHKGNAENLVTKLRKPRNLMSAVVAALLIVALGLYVKHAFRSIGTTESDPEL